jgi:hypothetical protein
MSLYRSLLVWVPFPDTIDDDELRAAAEVQSNSKVRCAHTNIGI